MVQTITKETKKRQKPSVPAAKFFIPIQGAYAFAYNSATWFQLITFQIAAK
jgi:hypothetical protein